MIKIPIWEYKGKEYAIVRDDLKININSEWHPIVLYRCLYENPDGMEWTRTKEDFYSKFKLKENETISRTPENY